MQVGIIADDLTGAMDAGAQLARTGYRIAVAFHGSPLPPAPNLDAVAVDTDSRHLKPEAAAERVRESVRRLRDARIFYKKLDSTLRGPIAVELDAALEESGRSRAIIAPAFPSTGRTTLDGVQLLDDEPLHETRLAEDPVTPVREAHLPSLLTNAGLEKVGGLGIGDLRDLARGCEIFEGCRWIVADATEDVHLKALVESVPDPSEVLWAGSAGLVRALGETYPGSEAGTTVLEPPVTNARVLTVVGSTNPAGRSQLQRLDESSTSELVSLRSGRLINGDGSAVEEALRSCRSALEKGMGAALYPTDDEVSPGYAGRIVEALAEVVVVLSEEGAFDALVLTGGDTAVHVARSLGAQGIMLEGEIEPGVPIGTLIADRPYRVITKAGGFGTPETLLHAHNVLIGKERPL